MKRKVMLCLALLGFQTFAAEVIDTGTLLGEYSVIRWMDNQRGNHSDPSGTICPGSLRNAPEFARLARKIDRRDVVLL